MLDQKVFNLQLDGKSGLSINEDGGKYYLVCIFKNNYIVVSSFRKGKYNTVCKNHDSLLCRFGDMSKFGVDGGFDNLLQNDANNNEWKEFLEANGTLAAWGSLGNYMDHQINLEHCIKEDIGENFSVMVFRREFIGSRMNLKRVKLKSWGGEEYLSDVNLEDVLRVMGVVSKFVA